MQRNMSLGKTLQCRFLAAQRAPLLRASLHRGRPKRVARAEPEDKADGNFETLFSKELQRRGMPSMDEPDKRENAEGKAGSRSTGSQPSSSGGGASGTNPVAETRSTSTGSGGSGTSSSSTRTRARAPPPPKAPSSGDGSGSAEGEGQRQRSMDMVNEGLGGLIPRVSRLFQLGGSLFLGFLPFMVAFSLLFSCAYFVFGPNFVHGGRQSRPAYVEPERLLSEPTVDPYIPFNSNPYSSPDLS